MSVFRKRYLAAAIILASQAMLSIFGGLVLASTPRENYIFPGVFISGIEVGGMTREQALIKLENVLAERMKTAKIILQYGSRQWSVAYTDLGVKYDLAAAVDSAMKTGRESGSLLRAMDMFRVKYERPDLQLKYQVDNSKLERYLNKAAREINIREKDAGVDFSNGQIKIFPEVTGIELKYDISEEKIKEAVGTMKSDPITAEVTKTFPRIKASDLQGINSSIGLGIIVFPRAGEANDSIAAVMQKLNGLLLRPEEIFSFNEVVGPIIKENNYRVPGNDEGLKGIRPDQVSRVASALYQAVLYAGLQVKERHAFHSVPDYVNMGEDAVVNFNGANLKFANSTGAPLYINAAIKANRIIINLLGSKQEGETMQISTEVMADDSPKEWHVKVYRIYYKAGIEIKRMLISDDVYY